MKNSDIQNFEEDVKYTRWVKKMYFSLIERKLRTTSLIFEILTFLNQDFSDLNFYELLFIFRFILAKLLNF